MISNRALFKATKSTALSNVIGEGRLRWAGHVRRMQENRVPKKVLFGVLEGGKSKRGKPRTTWSHCLEKDCGERNISNWINAASDRLKWKKMITFLIHNKCLK